MGTATAPSLGQLKRKIREFEIKEEEWKREQQALAEANIRAVLLVEEIQQKNKIIEAQQSELKRINAELEQRVRQRTAELEEINAKLRREMAEKEDFLLAVSHDLGAPLRNVAGMAASLLRKYGDILDEDAKYRLERIQSNVNKEMELIEELLELSRIRTKREKFENVNLQELIQGIKEELEYQLEEKGIDLILQNSLPTIHCEKNRIKQVFQNLIDNAIKYMGDVENPRIEIGSFEKNGRFTFWVKDNGVGIKKENQQRIFHIFRRGEGSAVAKVEGKGIGLASVKSIVENYDGEIWVESEEGKGSTFYFTLSMEIVIPKAEGVQNGQL